MPIHSSGQTVFRLPHIEGVTLGAGEEVDEAAGGASGMSVDRMGEISEGRAAVVYGAGFTAGPLTRKGARSGLRETGNKVNSEKELTEVGRMAEGDLGGQGRRLQVEGSDKFYNLFYNISLLFLNYSLYGIKNNLNV